MIRKVMTFKSGKFVFSRNYAAEELAPLLIEARVLYEAVKDLPILPNLAAQLEEELIRRSILGTAALEGNPLSEEEVARIISEPKNVRTTERAEKEIQNLKAAYDLLKRVQKSESVPKLDEKFIKDAHNVITLGIKYEHNDPGQYRNHLVKVGDREHGGIYTPPKCLADIGALMTEYVEWMNTDEMMGLEPSIRAVLAHYYLALIHPFGDGNGRTARLVEASLLYLSGIKYAPIMLSNYYYRNMDDYFGAFSKSLRDKEHNVTAFVQFCLKGFVESLRELKTKITYLILKLTLRDYYRYLRTDRTITGRQFDLMDMMVDHVTAFTLKDLHESAPFNLIYKSINHCLRPGGTATGAAANGYAGPIWVSLAKYGTAQALQLSSTPQSFLQ